MFDLHIHSTISGGSYNYKEILQIAKDKTYAAISVTDHDSYGNQDEISLLCQEEGILYLYGCEHTAFYNGNEIHILSYFAKKPSKEHIETVYMRKIAYAIVKKRIDKGKKLNFTNITDVVEDIHANEGIAILAHPEYYKDYEEIFHLFDGFELLHPDNTLRFIDYLSEKYKKYFFSCGTDMYINDTENLPLYELQGKYMDKFIPLFERLNMKMEYSEEN